MRYDPVARLVSQPYVVEALDALARQPLTQRRLSRILGTPRRRLTSPLRTLAAHGAIRRHDQHGSWDHLVATTYELTGTGRELVELLERADTWDALYGRYLGGDWG